MSNFGLVLFVVVVAVDAAALCFDLWLEATGRKTISEYVWDVPARGVAIVLWQLFGAAGIALHFYIVCRHHHHGG